MSSEFLLGVAVGAFCPPTGIFIREYLKKLRTKRKDHLTWSCDDSRCVFKVELIATGIDYDKIKSRFDEIVRGHIYYHAISDKKDLI